MTGKSELFLDGMKIFLRDADNKKTLLLDTLDVKNNRGRLRMQAIMKDEGGNEYLAYPFAEALMGAWKCLESDCHRVILILIAKYLIEKPRDIKIAFACEKTEPIKTIDEFIKMFSEKNQICVMNIEENINMIPRNRFDMVIAIDKISCEAALSVKSHGEVIFVSSHGDDAQLSRLGIEPASSYRLGENECIFVCRMTPRKWRDIYGMTVDGAIDELAEAADVEINALGNELRHATREQMGVLIKRMAEIESALVTLYPMRSSVTIKCTANRLKSDMIDYALAYAEIDEVMKSYSVFLADWKDG